eukprot:jgi/Picre1/30879/NNA_006238.t1
MEDSKSFREEQEFGGGHMGGGTIYANIRGNSIATVQYEQSCERHKAENRWSENWTSIAVWLSCGGRRYGVQVKAFFDLFNGKRNQSRSSGRRDELIEELLRATANSNGGLGVSLSGGGD